MYQSSEEAHKEKEKRRITYQRTPRKKKHTPYDRKNSYRTYKASQPPLQPPKLLHTPRGHTLAGGGPREQTLAAQRQCVMVHHSVLGVHGCLGLHVTRVAGNEVCGCLPQVQARVHFPPVSMAFRHLYEENILNFERHLISETMYHLAHAVLPPVTMPDVMLRNAPLVFDELLKDVLEVLCASPALATYAFGWSTERSLL